MDKAKAKRIQTIIEEIQERQNFTKAPDEHHYQVRTYEIEHCTDMLYHKLTNREVDFLKAFNTARLLELELELKKLL